jgi:hypothetical protein
MTGEIRTKLASSDAVASLKMEAFIANCFRARRWPAEQSVYFNDLETGKPREIDVISRQVLQRPQRAKGIGAPLINLSIICECKSLSGHNIIFLPGEIESWYENRMVTIGLVTRKI